MSLANVILEAHRAEESHSWQDEPFDSKNEMLQFVQHDRFPRNVIPSPFHGSLEMTDKKGPLPDVSFRTPRGGEKSLKRIAK